VPLRRISPRTGTLLAAAVAVALAAALLALTTCSNDDDNDETTDPSETTSTTTSIEDEVEAAYLAYREMVTRLLEAPDPEDPEISQRSDGENREFLVDRLGTLRTAGQALRFGELHQYSVQAVAVDGQQATVDDCTVDDASTVVVATGEVVSQGTTTELLRAELVLDSESWKVRTIESVERWAGVATCEQ
jgi:FlaG/FlaF family flagellin (archaellin)